jgi:hypothetical protein
MKATLEFDDKFQLLMAIHGPEAFALLQDIDVMIRNQLKHGEVEKDRETLESVRADIRELLERTYS